MRVLAPTTLAEACGMLADDPTAMPLAGGTDLLVHWPDRHEARDHTYVDLGALDDLRPMRWAEEALVLGGTTTYWDVIRDPRATRDLPLLVDAARQVGAVQIQARGTWAGNIVNASPAADGVPVLMAYDATVVLETAGGQSEVPLRDFYLGYKQMRRTGEQLVREIRVPLGERKFQRFIKVGSRRAQAIAKIGLATVLADDGWRVVAASLAPTVRRCPAIEKLLDGGAQIDSPDVLREALLSDVSPIDDIRSTAAYRETVAARVLFHDLAGAAPGIREAAV